MLEPGDQLFKLAAKRRTKDIYSMIGTKKEYHHAQKSD